MVMTSDKTHIQIFADWPMSHAKRVTKDNGKNPEYLVVAAKRRLRTDKTVPQKNHGQTMWEMSSISDLKRPKAPKRLDSLNTMIYGTADENAAGFVLFCFFKVTSIRSHYGSCFHLVKITLQRKKEKKERLWMIDLRTDSKSQRGQPPLTYTFRKQS